MDNTLQRLKEVLDKDIGEVVAKGTMTPAELERVTKALCAVEQIKRIDAMENGMDEASYGRSYGMNEASYMRGRDAQTGRYMSRGVNDWSYDRMDGKDFQGATSRRVYDGRSGHSIKDRMIDKLERMMDEAQTDHERQTVQEWIDRLDNRR